VHFRVRMRSGYQGLIRTPAVMRRAERIWLRIRTSSPLRCQRARVKFMRQRAVRVAGPDRIIFLRSLLNCLKNQPQRIQSFTKKAPQRTKDRAPHSSVALLRVTLDLCGKAFELAPAASEMPNSICVDLRFLFGLYFFGQPRALS
jgi:hypothetical protein